MTDEAAMTAQRAWDRVESHERLCTERWQAIRDDVKDLRSSISTQSKTAIGVMIAMLGWLAVQVYDRIENPVEHARPSVIKELKP